MHFENVKTNRENTEEYSKCNKANIYNPTFAQKFWIRLAIAFVINICFDAQLFIKLYKVK